MKAIRVNVVDLSREDLRRFSDSELSLRVYNDENLYNLRHRNNFLEILDYEFIYSEAQLRELLDDISSEGERE